MAKAYILDEPRSNSHQASFRGRSCNEEYYTWNWFSLDPDHLTNPQITLLSDLLGFFVHKHEKERVFVCEHYLDLRKEKIIAINIFKKKTTPKGKKAKTFTTIFVLRF